MPKFIRNNIYAIVAVLALAAIAFGGYKYYRSTQTQQATVKTAAVEYGVLREEVSATGSLSAIDNVDISSKITGRITAVYVKENDHVTANQLLLRLDDTALKATELSNKAKLDQAELTLNRYARLTAEGAISQSSYDEAYRDYQVAKQDYEQAVSNTNDTYIYSPIDGYIIGEPKSVGQTISSGISEPQGRMSVEKLDKMQIKAMVDESDIGKVKLGQKVEFTVDSYSDETFEGTVSLISRSATTTNNVVYYTVYVDVKESQGKLFPTMTARANIIVTEVNDSLIVPNNTIFVAKGGRTYVKVYDEKTKTETEVDVTKGLVGADRTQVTTDGSLRQGDKLVVKVAKATQTNGPGPGGPM